MNVCYVCACLWSPEDGTGSPEPTVRSSCELSDLGGHWKQNLGPLEKLSILSHLSNQAFQRN